MKRLLRQIYDDLANGVLSRKEALRKIEALKEQKGARTGALLATPAWRAAAVEAADASHGGWTEHHVVIAELPQVDLQELASSLPLSRCSSLQAGQQNNIAERYSEYAVACFERIRTILQGKPQGEVLVQIVVANHEEQALFAGLSKLLETAALENPQFRGQVVLVPPQITAMEVTNLLKAERRYAPDTPIRYEEGVRQALQWQELPEVQEKPPVAFRDSGLYLITGGLGGLGVLFAKEILERTRDARVVLTGRSALTAAKGARLKELSEEGGRVSYREADVADPVQVKQLIAGIREEYGQLNGILHCAGTIADNFILKKTSAEFRDVFAPKVAGTFNLDQATRDIDLDFFVLFSSIAGALGNLGQADYATANGFLDQFAALRNRQVAANQRHGRTRSINWPLWAAGAMVLDQTSQDLVQKTTGTQPMQAATGIDAFHRSLALPYDQILVAEGNLAQMRRAFLGGAAVAAERQARRPAAAAVAVAVAPDGLTEKTEDYLRKELSGLLKLPSHKIDPQAALETYGIDSILAMKLTSHLEQTFGSLSKTLFFEYQTIRDLANYFVQSHSARLATLFAIPSDGNQQVNPVALRTQTVRAAETRPAPSRRFSRPLGAVPGPAPESDPIAIIGLSGRYPEAVDIEAYWENLRQGKDCITEVPKERWDWREYFSNDRTQSGSHYSKWGGFIAGVDEFDPLFFNIAPKEAKLIDPQERLFLQHAWMAVEDAGYTRASLQTPSAPDLPGQVGVYVGLMYSEYQLFGAEASARGNRMGIAGSAASIANRVSYVFNLHGPSMTLDTMCSSSLTAIHVACQDLKLGRISMAIAGGVNVSVHPNKYLVLSGGQFISSDGHCQSFGEGGDGYIPGEGVGVVVLKRLSEAKKDGDHIFGIIRGSALNHGGKTNGYTVPNPQAQANAISRALIESQTDARHISYIEAHGTGTKLGDPIEITALSKAFQSYTQDTEFCLIGSVKSNVGHCESAAGVAGLTKVLLQMQHRQIVPSLHSAQLNPHIDFPRTPFAVNQTLRPWEQPAIDGRTLPRIAGVSSFGAGGSNAHVIVEEYQAPVPQPTARATLAMLISARTADQLQQKVRDLLSFVRARMSTLDLVAMAYTLQVGREAMDERLGLVVTSVDDLVEKLELFLSGAEGIEDAYQGRVKRNDESLSLFRNDVDLQHTIDKWVANRKLPKMLELWVKGLELDWSKLYGEVKPNRISLPTYPFAKERYWIDVARSAAPVAAKNVAAEVLHPLLHSNTSDLSEQRYRSTFTGDEFFLADHLVRADDGTLRKALPAVVYLEMARAAIEQARPAEPGAVAVELRDVVWAQSIGTGESRQVSVSLSASGADEIDYEIYSQDADQEIVHCQGRAVLPRPVAAGTVDLGQLERQMSQGTVDPSSVYAACARMGYLHGPSFQALHSIRRGSNQLLAHLRLPATVEDTLDTFVLHPSLIEGALQACLELIGSASESADAARSLFALESLHIVSRCTKEMVAWVRYSPGSHAADEVVKLDVDLYDARGNICAQVRGVSWQPASVGIVEQADVQVASARVPAAQEKIAPAREPKEVAFLGEVLPSAPKVERQKPAGISLAAPGTLIPALSSPGRPPVTLTNAPPGVRLGEARVPVASAVRLFDRGDGVFAIRITSAASDRPKDLIAHLLQALDGVRREAPAKVLMISGVEHCFARRGREDCNEAVAQRLYHAIVAFPYPVIAVLPAETTGAAFLFAALCDFMVCNEDASFGYTDPHLELYPTASEAALFAKRLGDSRAQDFLCRPATATGKQLRAKGWTCPIVPATQVEPCAEELASTLAAKPQDALRLLKQHLARHLVGLVDRLTRVEIDGDEREKPRDPGAKVASQPHLRLETPADDVLLITFRGADGPVTVEELVTDLDTVFAEIHQHDACKVVVLASESPEFLPESDAIPEHVVAELQRIIGESRIPVVAALDKNAKGTAWLVAELCDSVVYSHTGVYSSARVGASAALAQMAAAIFPYRFGTDAGNEILLTGAEYSGADLQRRVGSVVVVDGNDVLPAAAKLAASWAALPQSFWATWKKRAATTIQEKIRSLPAVAGWEPGDEAPGPLTAAPTAIALRSQVVTATARPDGIVVVTMQDRQAKNMFSDLLMEGLAEVFAHIEQTSAYKVVVLTGYDHYFASGGTKESLLDIQAGKVKFTDFKIFQLPLDCKLPVIAAVQGHGIGAGWCLGMFADVVLLSEESRYVSPYMAYGFTPGAGATWILAEKMGLDLSRESLLTAQPHAGSALKSRGLLLPVLPRAEVVPAAMALAEQIARAPRHRLMGLKQQLTAYAHEPLEETYRLELAMHDETFVGRSDTLAQIQNNFYQEVETASVVFPKPRLEPARPPVDGDVLPAVTATLKTLLANELQMRESDIDDDAQFVDLGLDSISGVTWVRKINDKFQTSIEATKVYSYSTLRQLSRYVKAEAETQGTLSSAGAPRPAETPVAPVRTPWQHKVASDRTLTSRRTRTARFVASAAAPRQSEPIAVIGMAGQFPQAKNLEEFWQNIAEGKNCITEVPRQRWDVTAYYQPGNPSAGKSNSQWLGALDEYDLFDPLFFNISPTEAESMDPQQRLFLQACWHSIEDAGYDARALSGSKCSVFVGCATGDYHQLSRRHLMTAHGFTGSATSILAARISYFLNLQGPCVSIDTACSSSLVAIAQACDSLASGVSDLALAGGVYVMAGPDMHIMTSQAGMLSPDGRCFTFDQRANGFVTGEGVGVVMLKRLADAHRDRDVIHGVIQGWGVNQDGRSNGITAPNPESQTRLEQDIYEKYGIDPTNIQLIEAHGTGTKLGDPIEVEGLKAAFRKYTQNKEYCALGSVKSNIGHCLTAAGIAGVIKLLLALKHRQLPPTINFERLNEHIDLTASPFYINDRLQEWKLNGAARRQAAVSSFGFSGTNAHIVIGENVAPAEVKRLAAAGPRNTATLIPLSARTKEQLRQRAGDLLAFLRKEGSSADLNEIAYTLQTGRAPMEERLGFLVSSIEQLAAKLEAHVGGEKRIEDAHQGQVKRNREALSLFSTDADLQQTVDKWIADGKLNKLLELWVKGLDLEWSKLYGDPRPRRISLPTYPFAKERYWISASSSEQNFAPGVSPAVQASILHPLLHSNTSDLSEQRYRTTFTGNEFFLADHRATSNGHADRKVLPGVVYLEMARAAISDALPAWSEATVLELRDTVWAQPIVVSGSTQVSISLLSTGGDQIEYEISSDDAGQDIVHCQGRAVLSREPAPAALDLEQLEAQMEQGQLEPGGVYAAWTRMGLVHGPSFQGITAIRLGRGQLLVWLRLPGVIANSAGHYVLHPSLMDGALQAAAGLIEESNQPRLPFALESLRILSPFPAEMIAWVRLSAGTGAAGDVAKLDVDVCDERGNVCAQMRGLSLRVLTDEITETTEPDLAIGTLLAVPVWQARTLQPRDDAGKRDYTQHHVILCELPGLDAEELNALIPRSQCLSLRAERQDTIAQRYSSHALACFERIRTILQSKPQGKVLVQVVTADDQEHAPLAGLSALLKTAALENPRFVGQLILVPSQTTAEELAEQLQAEQPGARDTLVRYEHGGRQVRGWQEVPEDQEKPPIAFRDDGVYLITGGLGALGLLFTREILARTRQARVVLTGRSALTAEGQARMGALAAQEGRLSYRRVDIGDLDDVKRLIDGIRDKYRQLNGVLHCAGMLVEHPIAEKPSAEFSAVLAPKVTGAFNLDQASQDVELDFFVLFSSIAGAMGNPRTADYATANAFLDQFATYRNAQVAAGQRHGRTRSINWPVWQDGGMGTDAASQERLQRMTGMLPMQTATGMQTFYRSLSMPHDQLLVVEGIQPTITAYYLQKPLVRTGAVAAKPSNAKAHVGADQLQQQLKTLLATVLRMNASAIDVDRAFVEFGLDSFLGTELVLAINNEYGTGLSNFTVFDHPTVRELARFLEQEIKRSSGPSEPAPAVSSIASSRRAAGHRGNLKKKTRVARTAVGHEIPSDERIAIIGMSGRYAQANNLQEYWDNLAHGRNSIAEVPLSRWDADRYYDPNGGGKGKAISKWLGALDDIDCFDPLFFRISPQEADSIDPHHRLFLQESYRAFEDAGYSIDTLGNTKCGVYLGTAASEYALLLAKNRMLGDCPVTSNHTAIAAARIAYYLNLKGPAISVDTACSSSLVAIHLACQGLLSHETDMALAGGVTLWLTPESYLSMTQAGMLSPVGQCKAFDDTADGIVVGDGVGALVLKRLAEAEADNDVIYGVILGSGINQDGRTNGITAPSVHSQIELERGIYAKYKIEPETISYVETHGTGTKLGDPIELEALATVFRERTDKKNFCAIGSVKSNIGHTTSAAGVAGVQKVLLSLRHRTLVPTLHVTRETSHFDFKNSPFYISRETQPWNVASGSLRRAAISSFGFSGTNAHLVIEEYPSADHAEPLGGDGNFIVPLSARTAEQLRQRSRDLLELLRAAEQPVDLAAVAYTLQVGREAMEERLGFVVSSVDRLAERLSAWIGGVKHIEGVHQGRVEPGSEGLTIIGRDEDMQEAIDKWIARKKLPNLLDLWIRGLHFDWNKLYGGVKPKRIPLPTYPFAKERYWVDQMVADQDLDREFQLTADAHFKSIEDIISRIDDDTTDTEQAVRALKMLV